MQYARVCFQCISFKIEREFLTVFVGSPLFGVQMQFIYKTQPLAHFKFMKNQ